MQVGRHVVLRAKRFKWNDFIPFNESKVGDKNRIHSAYMREIRRGL